MKAYSLYLVALFLISMGIPRDIVTGNYLWAAVGIISAAVVTAALVGKWRSDVARYDTATSIR